MGDIVIGEKWSTDASLNMALGVRRAIDSVLNGKKPPAECKPQIQSGVEFLREAQGGSAVMTGTLTEADSFTGTFSPLCLAIDVYIRFTKKSEKQSANGQKLSGLFQSYIEALQQLADETDKTDLTIEKLQEIAGFFEVLTDVLLQQADPMTKDYSRPYL